MNETIKIILEVIIALIVGGGALFAFKTVKQRKNTVKQNNITITGDGNKIIGGDDNTRNH